VSARRNRPKPIDLRSANTLGGRNWPADLLRREKILACTAEQCPYRACGQETTVIGYEQSEQLDLEPARYFVLVTRREKRACPFCKEGGVVAAALPARIIDKGLASDRVVIGTVVAKYSDHLPLYRQSAIVKRETGVEIRRATMDGWVMRVGDLLSPIAVAIGRELVKGTYIQADETPVGVQMHDGQGKNHQAYLWQYGRPGGSVVFDFRLGRGREGPKRFLGQFEGILQSDGYTAYEQVGGPKMVHACCWAHSGRNFIEALKLHPDDRMATRIVARIGELFSIDAELVRRISTTSLVIPYVSNDHGPCSIF
jgi:transposase